MPIIVDTATAPATKRREITTAIINTLDAAHVPTYLVDDLAKLDQLPADYAELHLSTRGRGLKRNGRSSVTGWRAQVRVVCYDVGNAHVFLDRATNALTASVFYIGGQQSTPLDEQPSDPPRPDGSYYSALAEWTFTL